MLAGVKSDSCTNATQTGPSFSIPSFVSRTWLPRIFSNGFTFSRTPSDATSRFVTFATWTAREVDFVVVEGKEPIFLVECKWADADVAKGLNCLKDRFPDCAAIQIHATGSKDYETARGVRVQPAVDFLGTFV